MRAHTRYSVRLLKPEAIFKGALNAECMFSSVTHRLKETSVAYLRPKVTLTAPISRCAVLSGKAQDDLGHRLFGATCVTHV